MPGIGLGMRPTGRRRRSIGPVGPWTPAQLFKNGVQGAWYEVADLSTVWADTAGTTPASVNGQVARLDDKSGNGNHALQATPSLRPLLKTDGAGKYWLLFDGSDDYLLLPNLMNGSATGAAIWAADRSGAAGFSALTRAGNSGLDSEEPFGDGNLYHDFGNSARPSFGAIGLDPNPYVLRFDRGTTQESAYKNGALVSTQTTPVGWGTAPRMGYIFNSKIHGMILLGRQLTASEAANGEAWEAALNGAILA